MTPAPSSQSRTLLVATTNPKKLTELKDFLADLCLQFFSLADFPHSKEVPENGKTFQENATLKALGYAGQTGLLTLAEDSGLCCDALEGAPGIYSARFAGETKSDRENNLKLLKLLEKVPDNCRGAHFKSAVAIARPPLTQPSPLRGEGKGEGIIGVVEGEVHGVISHEIRGTNGFGYDPVFFYPPFAKTFGEVPAELKYQISHRTQALRKAQAILKDYFENRENMLGEEPKNGR